MAADIPKRLEPRSLDDLPAGGPRFVGTSVRRIEDPGLLTGRVPFIDNVTLPGMLHCAILRSPYAHARITSIDTAEAAKLPGVFAIVTGEDALRWTQPEMSMPEGWAGHCLAEAASEFEDLPDPRSPGEPGEIVGRLEARGAATDLAVISIRAGSSPCGGSSGWRKSLLVPSPSGGGGLTKALTTGVLGTVHSRR